MVKLAIEEKEGLLFSDYENTLDQPSYTARTLQSLTDSFPDQDFYFILGEDSLNDLETWYHPEDVLRLARQIITADTFSLSAVGRVENAESYRELIKL